MENYSLKTISCSSDDPDPLEKIIKTHLGKYIQIFLGLLEDEIKKFYKFYLFLERAIHVKLNSILYGENKYKHFIYKDIITELTKLEGIMLDILELSDFINLNLTAIRKILKKFDKQFNLKSNPVALYYLKHKLKDSSSNLVYILQFKIIDESSAIIDRLCKTLKEVFEEPKKESQSSNSSDIEHMLSEPLLKEINISDVSLLSRGGNAKTFKKIIEEKFNKIRELNEKIDESNNLLRSNANFWNLNNYKTEIEADKLDEYKNFMVEYIEEENILENLIPQVDSNLSLKNEKIYFLNVWLTLIHTFLFTMNGFIVHPSNPGYLKKLDSSPFLTGVIISLTPLAAIISTFVYSSLINSGYKNSYFISVFCLIFGNFLYSFADYSKSVIIMGVGRIFVGLGGARVVNRRYLIEQIPNRLIMHYSLLYVVMICIGMATGPGLAMIFYSIPEFSINNINFDAYTYPGWFCFIIWIMFSFVLFTSFEDHVEKKIKYLNDFEKVDSPPKKLSLDSKEKYAAELRKINTTYHTTNLVEKDVQNIIMEESQNFSYLSISFSILSLVLFSIRVKYFLKKIR
jgi:hypothetical protein